MISYEFFQAAFKHDAATVQGFGPGLALSPKDTEEYMLALLAKAGVTLAGPPPLTEEEKTWIAAAPDLPDAYDMQPDGGLVLKLDFLWANFSATGRLRPIAAVASALAWRPDYEAFDKLRKSGKKPGKVTDSIMRGACYSAAGWSLGSFQRTDPHAADYIDAISADPVTPASMKDELAHLGTNPAFERQ